MGTNDTAYAQEVIRECVSEKARSISLIKFIIIFVVLLFPMAAFAMIPSDADRSNVTYTQAQIDSLVSVEVQRQVDTQLIGLKIDKAASSKLEKYIEEQTIIQARHDLLIGAIITILAAIVGIFIPLKLNQDREKKVRKMEKELSKMIPLAKKKAEFSIALTRAMASKDEDVRFNFLSEIIKDYAEHSFVSFAYNCRGNICFDREDYSSAIADYTKAIEKNPEFADAYYNRGNVFVCINNIKAAIKDFSKAINLNPGSIDYYISRGSAYGIEEEYDKTIKDFTKIIELNPNCADFYNLRACTYLLNDEYARAIDDYSKAIELNPDCAEYYDSRAYAYELNEEYNKALADYTKAIELDSNCADYYHSRGDMYMQNKNYHRAIKDYTKAIELNPDLAIAYHLRGDAYEEIGGTDKAKADHDKAKELGYDE